MQNGPLQISNLLKNVKIAFFSLFMFLFLQSAVFPQTITVNSPNGGEDWTVGTDHNITWTSSGVTGVDIEYSTNGGTDWSSIVKAKDAASGSVQFLDNTECSFI